MTKNAPVPDKITNDPCEHDWHEFVEIIRFDEFKGPSIRSWKCSKCQQITKINPEHVASNAPVPLCASNGTIPDTKPAANGDGKAAAGKFVACTCGTCSFYVAGNQHCSVLERPLPFAGDGVSCTRYCPAPWFVEIQRLRAWKNNAINSIKKCIDPFWDLFDLSDDEGNE